MKKRILSAFIAGMTGAIFGVLYPEYILLPDTYQYIEEIDCQKQKESGQEQADIADDIDKMLYSESNQIIISSRLLQFLADEGIILWKNLTSDRVDMQ